ncbi:12011_t:CDS:2 [Entrophospora sp. SA101]|nr:12011_t:CDS:2 [Entrophospora sp. SA101]
MQNQKRIYSDSIPYTLYAKSKTSEELELLHVQVFCSLPSKPLPDINNSLSNSFTIYYSTTTTTYISAIPFSSSSIFTTNQNQLMTVDDLTRILKDIKVRKQVRHNNVEF